MKNKPIHNKKELETIHENIRTKATSAEAFLWNYLKQRRLGDSTALKILSLIFIA